MREIVWLDADLVMELYAVAVDVSGGAIGVRDPGLLASALARAPNRHAYEGVDDIAELAATYAVAVSGNHPFLDDNGYALTAASADVVAIMLAVASGEAGLEALTGWVCAHVAPA